MAGVNDCLIGSSGIIIAISSRSLIRPFNRGNDVLLMHWYGIQAMFASSHGSRSRLRRIIIGSLLASERIEV